jgi:hypothetical protein
MSVEGYRVHSRVAACCILALVAAMALPATVMAEESDTQTYYDSVPESEGILCKDSMIEEPYTDELEPTPAAHVDGGCTVSDLPIST